MFCTSCGKNISDDASFCTECGAPVPPEVKAMFAGAQRVAAQAAASTMSVAAAQAPVAQEPVAQAPVAQEPVTPAVVAPIPAQAAPAVQETPVVQEAPAPAASAAPSPAASAAPAYTVVSAQPAQQRQAGWPERPSARDAGYEDPYEYSETSVLPEYPEELDTVVWNDSDFAPKHAASTEWAWPNQAALPVDDTATTGLQANASFGEYEGDDSDTMVLMDPMEEAEPQCTLQLTRSNGETCVLSMFPTVIGKGTDADLIIEGNSAVSRHHVRILRDGDVFAAEDLGSTNKTYIGEYELQPNVPTILSDGDVLKLGNEEIEIKVV